MAAILLHAQWINLVNVVSGRLGALPTDSLLVEDSGARRRRRRRAVDDDYNPTLEIVWDNPELEAKAIQICRDNIQCQFDFLSTKDESLANKTATSQMNFEEEQSVLGKYISQSQNDYSSVEGVFGE